MVQRVILCVFLLLVSPFEVKSNNVNNLCNSISTCGDCIRRPSCAWCSSSDETVGTVPRCFQPDLNLPYLDDHCAEDEVYFPSNSIDLAGFANRQLTPAKINLQLRVGEPLYFVVHFDKLLNNTELSIALRDNSSQYLSVEYISRCLGDYKDTDIYCDNITQISRFVHFNVKMELNKCPDEREDQYHQFKIFSDNSTEAVEVNVEMLCSCICENPGFLGYQLKAKECNGVGTLKCGVCECDSAHIGKNCECPLKTYSKLGCRGMNTTNEMECSGRGTCLCNKCVCNETKNIRKIISGDFCECDNFSCAKYNGKICGGNGVCNCGKCSCNSRYTGSACECYNSTTFCYPPFKKDGLMCNGHGECICGKCRCDVTEDRGYHGTFCEKCTHCVQICENLKPCVLCQVYRQGPFNNTECAENCLVTVTVVDQVQVDIANKDFLCNGQDENGCAYVFTYQKNKHGFDITAQRNVQCL